MKHTMTYHPEIDGLRALAVTLVFLFHLGFTWCSGGYIGVDVFFVISGYLITHILKKNIFEHGGLNLKEFYIRRAKRIMPAFLFTTILTLLVGILLLSQLHLESLSQSIIAALLFSSNFLFWSQSNYFDINAIFKPLLHTWSLGVEEQFYIFWPFFIFFISKKVKATTGVFLFVLIFLTSFLINFIKINRGIFIAHPEVYFYFPFFRIFEFMLGAALVWIKNKTFDKNKMCRIIQSRAHSNSNIIKIFNEISVIFGLGLILYAAVKFTPLTSSLPLS